MSRLCCSRAFNRPISSSRSSPSGTSAIHWGKVGELAAEVLALRAEIAALKKNSRNSSRPPSSGRHNPTVSNLLGEGGAQAEPLAEKIREAVRASPVTLYDTARAEELLFGT